MLQQTPVARVLPVWTAWLAALADPGRPCRRAGRRGGPGLGPARLPATGAAPARRRSGDRGTARRPGARVVRRPAGAARASATTPRRPSRRSPTGSGTSCSTPTCAGCWRAPCPASSSRSPAVTRAERELATRLLPEDEPTGRHLGGRGDGARRPGVHGRQPRVRPVPAPRPVRVASPPDARRTTARPARCRRTPAPTGSAAAGCWPCCATRRAASPGPRSTPRGPTGRSASARLASLVTDGLVVALPDGRFALP